MSDSYDLSELARTQAGIVRFGVITELDEANARVKVNTAGLDTDWLPWLTARAGTTRTWSAPTVGEQVVVLAESGNPSQGVVLPSIYQDAHPAPVNTKDKDHTVFPDGTTIEHDSASNTYTITVAGSANVVINCKHATVNADDDATVNTKEAKVNASTSLVVDSPQSTFTGQVLVQGLLTYTAGMAGSGTGPGGKTAQINGDMEFINGHGLTTDGGDVVAGGKSLIGHTHKENGTGAQTDPPT